MMENDFESSSGVISTMSVPEALKLISVDFMEEDAFEEGLHLLWVFESRFSINLVHWSVSCLSCQIYVNSDLLHIGKTLCIHRLLN